MSVSAVSLQEISDARSTMPVMPQVSKQPKAVSSSQEKRFIDRFSDKKIADFFAPYGYITHERSDDAGAVLVMCDNCQIIFDDFTVMAEPVISLFKSDPEFDFVEFAALCEQSNITPSQAISDRLEEEIFNPMPYYVERKKRFNENNFRNIARNKKYGSLLQSAVAKQNHRETLASLNKTYGSSDPEKIADTLARVIPGR